MPMRCWNVLSEIVTLPFRAPPAPPALLLLKKLLVTTEVPSTAPPALPSRRCSRPHSHWRRVVRLAAAGPLAASPLRINGGLTSQGHNLVGIGCGPC